MVHAPEFISPCLFLNFFQSQTPNFPVNYLFKVLQGISFKMETQSEIFKTEEDCDAITESLIFPVQEKDGRWSFQDGSTFSGALENGCKQGHGVFTFSKDGKFVICEGVFAGDKPTGLFKMSYPDRSVYEGILNENFERHGKGTLKSLDSVYNGDWCNDLMNGEGILNCPDGVYESGGFNQGKLSGDFVITYSNGSLYHGHLENSLRDGWGTLTGLRGDTYEGEWVGGLRQGFGTKCYENGETYVGLWHEDKMHGEGSLTDPSGCKYAGMFENGERHDPHGIQTTAEGDVFEGPFVRNVMRGQFTVRHVSGDVYCGQIVDDLRDGYGVANYAGGAVYKGEWKQGARHGQGELTLAEGGSIFSGMWIDDKQQGQGTFHCNQDDGTTYEYVGQWAANERSGLGQQTWDDGFSVAGEWLHNKPVGESTVVMANGELYVGAVNKDYERHGQGTHNYANGAVFKGLWVDNKMSEGELTDAEGSVFRGTYDLFTPSSQGVKTRKNGTVQEGYFLFGMFMGPEKDTEYEMNLEAWRANRLAFEFDEEDEEVDEEEDYENQEEGEEDEGVGDEGEQMEDF